MTVDLGQILLDAGRITAAQLAQARAHAESSSLGLDQALTSLDVLTEDQLADALGRRFEIPGVSLARLPRPNARVTALLPEKFARTHGVVPLEKAGDTLILLMMDPADIRVLQAIRTQAGVEVQPVVATTSTVRGALDTFYPSLDKKLLASVVPFVGKLITEEAARTYRALPVDRDGNILTVAIAGPDADKVRKAIEMATGLQVRPVAARWEDIELAIERVHRPPAKPAAPPPPDAPPARAPQPAAPAPAAAATAQAAPAPSRPAAPSAHEAVQSLDELLGSSVPATAPQRAAHASTSGAPAGGGGSLTLQLTDAGPPPGAAPMARATGTTPSAKSGATLDSLLGEPVSAPPGKPKGGNGSAGHGTLATEPVTAEAPAGPSPNLGAGGGKDGPRTGLKVEASEREKMKGVVAKAWGELDPKLAKVIPEKVARNYRVVVTGRLNKTLHVAMENPKDTFAIETVAFVSGLQIEVKPASAEEVEAGLEILYGEDDDQMADILAELSETGLDDIVERGELEALGDMDAARAADAAPVVKLVNVLIDNAIRARASDIHFEVYEEGLRIRYRIDGVLREVMRPPMMLRDPLVSRLKIMGKMDISERRLPQDGRLRLRKGKGQVAQDIDFRISSVPTIHGEKVVMRILDRGQLKIDLTQLGMEQGPLDVFRDAIHKPYGMCLVVGPSGSGKTNTLYSALADVNTADVNIITCEDPVEFSTKGLNQVQAREQIGLSFATALRAFLRQDPNIILVGEVRDFETAEIAVKAALTGHMVLSTLHTNDAPACLNRLTNMGVEPFLIASSLHVVVAQRLVRRICDKCRTRDDRVPLEQLVQMGFEPDEAKRIEPMRGLGCGSCEGSGFYGRTGLFEVLKVTDEMREMILYNGSQSDIKQLAIRQGMRTLRHSGLVKVRDGITSCEEIIRETIA